MHGIEVQNQLGTKVVVVHHRATGPAAGRSVVRRTRLSAPTTGPMGRDEKFAEKVRELRTFWAAHRDLPAA